MSGASIGMGALTGAGAGAMVAGPWGAAAGAVVGAGIALWGDLTGANQRKAETEEAVRRMKLRQAQYLGQATSRASASGVEFDSESIQTYLSGMAEQFRMESDWAAKNGATLADAQATAGWLGFGNAVVKAAGDFGASQNWFQTPSEPYVAAGEVPKFGEFNLKPPDISGLKWP